MDQELSLVCTEKDGWAVVAVGGEVDMATAPALRSQLHDLLTEGHNQVVVDLDGVGFLDSTGLGVLIGVLKRARTAGGDVRLVCSEPRLLRVFEVTRLDAAFAIRPTVNEALAG